MKYYEAANTGKGFITHEDNELSHISGYPGNIWVTDNEAWASRVGATELTKVDAQAKVDTAFNAELDKLKAEIDAMEESELKNQYITRYMEDKEAGIVLP